MTGAATTDRLDSCGCCEAGVHLPTIFNAPGHAAIGYRIGTHSSFLARMLAGLPGAPYPQDLSDPNRPRPLESLTTRSIDDPAIALLDGWATVADVLTFYQERIANEGFLRTSTELRSILELARSIGYELQPGVAAGAYLTFTVETAVGAPESAIVNAGTKVKSIPGQDERPQTFETTSKIIARAEWNVLRPRRSEPQPIVRGQKSVRLAGVATGLQPGDGIVIVGDEREGFPGSERWDFRIVSDVRAVPSTDPASPSYSVVSWELGLGEDRDPGVSPSQVDPRVYALRRRASLFGHNAPDWRTMPGDVKLAFDSTWKIEDPDLRKTQWPDFELPTSGPPVVDLDAYYPRILPGSWIVLDGPTYTELYRVAVVEPSSRTDFGISAKTTRIRLDASEHLSWFGLRSTVVHAESDELPMAEVPVTTPVGGRTVVITPAVTPPAAGQFLVFSGRLAGSADDADRVSEVAIVELVTPAARQTTIRLTKELLNSFDATDLTICANVAPSTHGESVDHEVLGGGDGTATFQRFALKKPPLTFVPASTPSGASSTLTVRVNDVAWTEAPSLCGLGPKDERYILRIDEAQRASVVFGDGSSGSRLPTGPENVVATYRSGLGPEGNVKADALTLLQTRPHGIRGVTNPLPAEGGTAPETLDEARANAPLTVLTLDRAVSLQDYEDFSRAFAGIAKAQATSIWTGQRFAVHVTVAGPGGAILTRESLPMINLRTAVDLVRDPGVQLQIDSHRQRRFLVQAQVLADERRDPDAVFAAVINALGSEFSFDRRGFAQPVTSAEVIAAIQRVDGVIASNLLGLVAFDAIAPPPPDVDAPRLEILPAERASLGRGGYVGSELLLIAPDRITVEPMAP
jgi:predicted phage baseplate assembly protein